MSPRHSSYRPSLAVSRISLAMVIVGLVVRLVYVPMHLVQEDHLPGAHHGHVHACEEDANSIAFHDDDHEPHPAVDHECDLAFERVANTAPTVVWAFDVRTPLHTEALPAQRGVVHDATRAPPRSVVPRARLGRAPPSSV